MAGIAGRCSIWEKNVVFDSAAFQRFAAGVFEKKGAGPNARFYGQKAGACKIKKKRLLRNVAPDAVWGARKLVRRDPGFHQSGRRLRKDLWGFPGSCDAGAAPCALHLAGPGTQEAATGDGGAVRRTAVTAERRGVARRHRRECKGRGGLAASAGGAVLRGAHWGPGEPVSGQAFRSGLQHGERGARATVAAGHPTPPPAPPQRYAAGQSGHLARAGSDVAGVAADGEKNCNRGTDRAFLGPASHLPGPGKWAGKF